MGDIDVSLPKPWRGSGLHLLAPLHLARIRIDAPNAAIEGREVDPTLRHDGRRDDIMVDLGLPERCAFPECKGTQPMGAASRIDHKDAPGDDGGLRQEWITQPAVPNLVAGDSIDHLQRATLGVV